MKVSKFKTYRSEGKGVHQTDDRVQVTIDCSVNEFNQYFRNDNQILKIENLHIAVEACKKFENFHSQIFCGYPLEIKGKPINHTTLNETYDLVNTFLKRIKE